MNLVMEIDVNNVK
jgi:hypothetical protein